MEDISLWKLQYITVCLTVYPSAYMSSLANVPCNESLVCFETSGFRDTISSHQDYPSSSGFLLVTLLLPCVVDFQDLQDWPFHTSQIFVDDTDLGLDHLRALDGPELGW